MKSQDVRNKSMGLKVLSLLMAIMLWFYVVNQGGGLATGKNMIKAELSYYHVPAGLTVVGPRTVSVKLWGSFGNADDIVAYVDLAGMSQGQHMVPVKVKPLKGAMFATVQPDKVKIELQELDERTLTIKSEVKQNPESGFKLREILFSPEKCLIRGEHGAVNRVAAVNAVLDLSSLKGIGTFQVVLQAIDAHGDPVTEGITMIPETVKVYAVVEAEKELKKITVKPQFKGKAAEGFKLGTVSAEPAEVSLLGDKISLDSITEILTREIDLTDKKESFTQTIEVQVPEGTTASPLQVDVKVGIDKIPDKEVP